MSIARIQMTVSRARFYRGLRRAARKLRKWWKAESKKRRPDPRWESILDEDGGMCRVRWSEPDSAGRYLWVGHYPGTSWGQHAAERSAEDKNARTIAPWEFREWRTDMPGPTEAEPPAKPVKPDIVVFREGTEPPKTTYSPEKGTQVVR